MPFKHQTNSYRTRLDIRYECDGDVVDESQGDLKEQAISRVAELRLAGHKAFYEHHPNGYYRVFRTIPHRRV